MKLTKSKIKDLLQNKKEDTLLENLLGYYFKGILTPALITENNVIFYSLGKNKFYISEYKWEKDGLVLNGIKKLSFSEEPDEETNKILESKLKNIFEINENGKMVFKKSLKELKSLLEEDEIVLNEDVFLDRMKEIALVKAKKYLSKEDTKGYDNWNSAISVFSDRMAEISDKIKERIMNQIEDKVPGKELDSFYDMYDIKKIKFVYDDGKDMYKTLKIELPKDKIWIKENEELLKAKDLEYKKELEFYSSAVEDAQKLLKSKKYVEDEEKDPSKERVSELLGILKRKENVKETFWQWDDFKKSMKDLYENEIEVEDFIEKYDILNTFTAPELQKLVEKTLLRIYDDPKMVLEAEKIAEVLDYAMDESGLRENYFEEILGTPVNNVKELLNESDLGYFIKSYRHPDDFTIILVKNLAQTIEDEISRYRETELTSEELKTLETTLFKLNDIWARQRLTEEDKKFLKVVMEELADFSKKDKEASEKIIKAKDEYRKNIIDWENIILSRNYKKKINEASVLDDENPVEFNKWLKKANEIVEKLKEKARKQGFYENFGQKEIFDFEEKLKKSELNPFEQSKLISILREKINSLDLEFIKK